MSGAGDVDRARAARVLGAAGLDALVLAAPEAFRWATGASGGPPALFRRAGAALALLPADPGVAMGAVVTDLVAGGVPLADTRAHPCWVETAAAPGAAALAEIDAAQRAAGRPTGFARPTTVDPAAAFALLRDMLAERGLSGARIGLDLDFWPVADFRVLEATLPGARLSDGSAALERIRWVKSPAERARLALAGRLAEAGLVAALPAMRPGAGRDAIAAAWRAGAEAAAAAEGAPGDAGYWEYIAFGPAPWGAGGTLAPGDVLKADVGAVVGGASSDSARTFTLGPAPDIARRVHDALMAGFEAGLAALRPGAPLAEVHRAATAAIRAAGLPGFSRGHFGHGLGAGVFGEMAPFLAADETALAEPGMVLAFEAPFYVDGVGGFIVEDQFEIDEAGATPLWSLPRGLEELPL